MATWKDFEDLEIRVGTIVNVEEFPEARKPAYKIWVDFGDLGVKKTSARITDLYQPEDLVGKQVIGVLGLGPKQIWPFVSEFLLTGFETSRGVVLAVPDGKVPNGERLR